MNKKLLWCIVTLLATLVIEVRSNPVEPDSLSNFPRKEPLKIYERSFKPSFYDTEVYLYNKNDSTKSYGRAIDNYAAAPPETLMGFRIQLIATTNYDEVLSVKNDLNSKYPDLWIYTVFEAPTYKIRIGDFTNRADAKEKLDAFRIEGFKTAWIVPDRIIKNQPEKPPLPEPIDSTSVSQEDELINSP